jgi:hypothetical protein
MIDYSILILALLFLIFFIVLVLQGLKLSAHPLEITAEMKISKGLSLSPSLTSLICILCFPILTSISLIFDFQYFFHLTI